MRESSEDYLLGVPVVAQQVTDLSSTHEEAGLIPDRDPVLLGLWCRPAAAALIQPLAWGPPYAVAVAYKE